MKTRTARKSRLKLKAPVRLTGGGGFDFEDCVAARFLLDLVSGANSLGSDFGEIVRIDWQARDSGWLADDLAVTCNIPGTGAERSAGLSIKSNRQVTASGFPSDFVTAAWAQWLGAGTTHKIEDIADGVVLITGQLAQDIEADWSRLLRDASETTPERMVARLSSSARGGGSQASARQRALFKSLGCPQEFRDLGDTDEKARVRLLQRIRLIRFDFQTKPSRHANEAVADCQKVLRSGDPAEAVKLWDRLQGICHQERPAGGSVDLRGVLRELRGEFDLVGHPNFARDWQVLGRLSLEEMADVRADIGGLASLPREETLAAIQTALEARGACFLAGELGSGKSALAKQIATKHYRRVLWFTPQMLDHPRLDVESALQLSHPIAEIVSSSPGPCLIVFDAVESYTENALRMAARIMCDIHDLAGSSPGHLLFSAQVEGAGRTIRRLTEFGAPRHLLETTPVPRPLEAEVTQIARRVPRLGWAVRRPELRPLLTNLKILDWCARTLQTASIRQDHPVRGVTAIIDLLWEHWAERGEDSLARSHLLMRIATLEPERLSSGVPRLSLTHNEQEALSGLIGSDLVRLRDERVRFSHDLLGDWARMRALLGDEPLTSESGRKRAAMPQWHRAIRLFAQRLLEKSGEGVEEWRSMIDELGDDQQSSALLRDLFLEALFLATNATELLERGWGVLAANYGQLLNRLLNRFLFVATLPDPRLSQIAETAQDVTRFEHLFRIPFAPYWGAVLAILHAHLPEVASLAQYTAARVCSLWLKTTPVELRTGQSTPWRREAAELSLAIAREIQARNAEGGDYSDEQDREAYQAALYAASDLRNEIGQLCLELANRRDPSANTTRRARAASRKGAVERHQEGQASAVAASVARKLAVSNLPRGQIRPPWPDGPRGRVEHSFIEACLNGDAFSKLVRADPAVALEVLLAVSIEEPKEEHVFGRRWLPECGLSHWSDGDPPMYFRGPFLAFLQTAPEQAITFVIKLTNFATLRFIEDGRGLEIAVDGTVRKWLGDKRVIQWARGRPLSEGALVECALMALERWLYELIDKGISIEPWAERIMRESKSLAFAGLLIDVGKRLPELFSEVLKPLLYAWELWDLDLQLVMQRHTGPMVSGSWWRQPSGTGKRNGSKPGGTCAASKHKFTSTSLPQGT